MSTFKYIYTCKVCSFNNPSGSKKCNSCGHEFSRPTSYHTKVECPDCRRLNMADNVKCYQCGGSIKPGPCYIATACYGDFNAPEVKLFREFRDTELTNSIHGRLFVKSYYFFSPIILKIIGDNNKIHDLIKKHILDKIYKKLLEKMK
jgi:ribosomal protein S27E